ISFYHFFNQRKKKKSDCLIRGHKINTWNEDQRGKTVLSWFSLQVFSLLILQLLFTFSVVCVFTFSTVVKEAVQTNLWAYLSSFIIFAVVAIALSFSESFSRRHPWNVVGLAVVTLSLSYMVGTIASFHDTYAVIIMMGVTLVITVSIILFSAQTKWDFTICYGVVLILAVDLIMFFFPHPSQFLLIDCQLMMGVMSFRLDPEEYVRAALTIYLDIILLFLYLLGRR
uniref:Si:ch211-284o19.8 n=1 Tax=Gouania willdenowi TaxID=441366 RepID=A0A8C5GC96_GOUWI